MNDRRSFLQRGTLGVAAAATALGARVAAWVDSEANGTQVEQTPVEYTLLRPRQLVERRKAVPAAYIGLGVLEWHGLHNPLGLDGLKAHLACCRFARRLGGVVMPPLFWGDYRKPIMETIKAEVAAELGLSHAKLQAEARRCEEDGGWEPWHRLMVRMLFETESLGFRLVFPYPGHYPLRSEVGRAAEAYTKAGGQARVVVLEDQLAGGGDHAARIETSMMMALAPELVDLGQLDPKADTHLGVSGVNPLQSTAEFGRQRLDMIEATARAEIERLLKEK